MTFPYPTDGQKPWSSDLRSFVHENTKARYGSPPVGSAVDVHKFIAPNGTQLSIDTYPVDPNNEVVEPSVWYDPNGLFGYEYWMAAGPYPNADATFENPSIWASHDGQTWVIPAGGSNPVVPAPDSGNYDDPHLFEKDGALHLVWNYSRTAGLGDQVMYSYTTDGITWSAGVVIRTSAITTAHEYLSPHIEYQNGLWYMWTVNLSGTRTIYLSTATSLTGTWSAPTACTMSLPSGKDHWEFEIRRVGSEWWMLQCVVNTGGTSSGGELRFRTSQDGLTWSMSRRPVLTGTGGSGFDGNFIYKASFVPLSDGRMAIWYSAGSGGTLRWSIGYTVADTPHSTALSTGLWYAPCTSVATASIASGTATFLPIYLDRAVSLQAIGAEVTTVGTAGSVIELGVYDDNGSGKPGKLIASAGTISGTAAAVATLTYNQVVGPGVVWLAACSLGAPATNPTLRTASSAASHVPIGTTSAIASPNALTGHRQNGLASLPATANVNTSLASSAIVRVIYQAT